MRIKVGLVGFGVIGSGVVALLQQHAEILRLRSGVELVLARIADVEVDRPRLVTVDRALLTTDFREILDDPTLDIVIELVGGITVARDVVRGALERGKHVVTANKALLYHHKEELFSLATAQRRELRFEASVAGGIPIIKVLTESLASDRVHAMFGIVNGTTNFILTRMIEEHWSFADSLARAQSLGFAEADPSLDVNGGDATHKLEILATVAFNARFDRALLQPVNGLRGGAGTAQYRRALDGAVFSTAWSYVDHIVLPPGASVGPQNPGNLAEIYYVIGGSGSATVGSETAALKKDDIMPVNTTQTRTVVNNGSEPLELLVLGIAKDLAAKEAFLAIPRPRPAPPPPPR